MEFPVEQSEATLCTALLTGDGVVEGELKFSPLWEGNSPGKALFCSQHMIFKNYFIFFLFFKFNFFLPFIQCLGGASITLLL